MPRKDNGEMRAAEWFSLSTIPQISNAAKASLKHERAKSRQHVNLGNGIIYNPNSGETQMPQEYRDAVQATRQHQLDMLNKRLDAQNTPKRPSNLGRGVIWDAETEDYYVPDAYLDSEERDRAARRGRAEIMRPIGANGQPGGATAYPIGGRPPSPGQEAKAREAYRLSGEAETLRREVEQNPDAIGPTGDPVLDWMKSGEAKGDPGILSYFAPAVERLMYDPTDLKLRASLARYESDLSKLAAGLAVTGFEMSDRKKWSPFAPGLSASQVQDRLGNLQGKLLNQFYGSYGLESPQEAGAPMPAPAPTRAPPREQNQESGKIIEDGGKRYQLQGNKWVEL